MCERAAFFSSRRGLSFLYGRFPPSLTDAHPIEQPAPCACMGLKFYLVLVIRFAAPAANATQVA